MAPLRRGPSFRASRAACAARLPWPDSFVAELSSRRLLRRSVVRIKPPRKTVCFLLQMRRMKKSKRRTEQTRAALAARMNSPRKKVARKVGLRHDIACVLTAATDRALPPAASQA